MHSKRGFNSIISMSHWLCLHAEQQTEEKQELQKTQQDNNEQPLPQKKTELTTSKKKDKVDITFRCFNNKHTSICHK